MKIRLIAYWALLSIFGLICFEGLKPAFKMHIISSRKLFHVLTFAMFLPGIYFEVLLSSDQRSSVCSKLCISGIGITRISEN